MTSSVSGAKSVLLIDFMKNASVIENLRDFEVSKILPILPPGALIKVSGLPLEDGVSEMYVVAQAVVKLFRHWANDHVNLIFGLDLSQRLDVANLLKEGRGYPVRVVVEDYSETYVKEGLRAITSIEIIQEDFGPSLGMARANLPMLPHFITQLVQEYLLPNASST